MVNVMLADATFYTLRDWSWMYEVSGSDHLKILLEILKPCLVLLFKK